MTPDGILRRTLAVGLSELVSSSDKADPINFISSWLRSSTVSVDENITTGRSLSDIRDLPNGMVKDEAVSKEQVLSDGNLSTRAPQSLLHSLLDAFPILSTASIVSIEAGTSEATPSPSITFVEAYPEGSEKVS